MRLGFGRLLSCHLEAYWADDASMSAFPTDGSDDVTYHDCLVRPYP